MKYLDGSRVRHACSLTPTASAWAISDRASITSINQLVAHLCVCLLSTPPPVITHINVRVLSEIFVFNVRISSVIRSAINSALIDELELDSMPRPRSNSFDLGENPNCIAEAVVDINEQTVAAAGLIAASGMTKYENQESGFTHRRYTTDSVKRNEMSNEKLLLTKQKIQQEWVGEEVIRQPVSGAAEEEEVVNDAAATEPLDTADAGNKDDGKSKKKRRKKSIMKKKNSQRKNSSSSSNGSAGSESTLLGGKDTDSSSSFPTPGTSAVKDGDSAAVVVVASGAASKPDSSKEGFKPIQPDRQGIRDMDMHFFSDTEVTSTSRNNNSERPSTPVLSDTEFEMSQRGNHSDGQTDSAWKWGELPTPPGETSGDATKSVGQRKSMLTAMFSFMQQNRKGDGGLYLSDLDAEGMDPEVAALYFPEQRNKLGQAEDEEEVAANGRTIKYQGTPMEDDRESGNGTSLPHSPSSVELGSKMMVDSDLDESRERNLEYIALSTCGGLETSEPTPDEFDKYLVTYSEVRTSERVSVQVAESQQIVVHHVFSNACVDGLLFLVFDFHRFPFFPIIGLS